MQEYKLCRSTGNLCVIDRFYMGDELGPMERGNWSYQYWSDQPTPQCSSIIPNPVLPWLQPLGHGDAQELAFILSLSTLLGSAKERTNVPYCHSTRRKFSSRDTTIATTAQIEVAIHWLPISGVNGLTSRCIKCAAGGNRFRRTALRGPGSKLAPLCDPTQGAQTLGLRTKPARRNPT